MCVCVCLIVSASVTLPCADVKHELTHHVAQRVGGVVPQLDFLNNLANIVYRYFSCVFHLYCTESQKNTENSLQEFNRF